MPDGVQAVVRHGHVTLTGQVSWIVQKENAEKAVRPIRGVRGVLNDIDVRSNAAERDVRHRIVEALHRDADLDACHISVAVSGAVATLGGSVRTWLQRAKAGHAAGHALLGITQVDNRIVVEPPERPEAQEEIC